MNKNNSVVIGLLIIIIIILAFLLFKPKDIVTPKEINSYNQNTTPQVNTLSEESSNETFGNQPGAVKSVKKDGNNWVLAVDLLTPNTKWLPGVDSSGGFFINQNTKIRNLIVSNNTKVYDCGRQYADGNTVPPTIVDTTNFISKIENIIQKSKTDKGQVGEFGYTAYFDIAGTNITRINEQCLP